MVDGFRGETDVEDTRKRPPSTIVLEPPAESASSTNPASEESQESRGDGETRAPEQGESGPQHEKRVVGNRYVIGDQIGAGGMGVVSRAHDRLLQRDVAVKEVLIPEGLPDRERELLCERTLREARAAARIDHPSVIRVYDVVLEAGQPWIIMELLDSASLADVIKDTGILPPLRAAEIGLAVLSALQAAHRLGILHRDVKPGNVLLCANGRVVLTDFGVARSPNETPLTSTGLLLGSPQYIAPERARGRPFDAPSDLFSLAATLYAALEGRPPFDRGEPLPTMTAVVCEEPDPMPNAGPLADVLLELLEKDPAKRLDAETTRASLKAIIAAEKRRAADTAPIPTVPHVVHATRPPPASTSADVADTDMDLTTNTRRKRGRHRRHEESHLFTSWTKPIMSAAEATAAIVISRSGFAGSRGRHAGGRSASRNSGVRSRLWSVVPNPRTPRRTPAAAPDPSGPVLEQPDTTTAIWWWIAVVGGALIAFGALIFAVS